MKLIVAEAAQVDIAECSRFWERKAKGLGWEYLDYILDEQRRLLSRCERGIHSGKTVSGLRKLKTERFSANFYYSIGDVEVVLHGVFDSREDPEWIVEQLRSR